jgi:hypothetical protein
LVWPGHRLPTGAAFTRLTKASPVMGLCGLGRVARGDAVPGQPDTPARGRAGLGTSHAAATCVHDQPLCEPPDNRRNNSSVPGCGPTSQALHGTPADHRAVSPKKWLLRDHAPVPLLLLRDHAPPQPPGYSPLGAKSGRVDGAHVGPRRAELWPHRPGDVAPAAAPPASGGAAAGIQGPGSNAGSTAAAGTGGHSLCAGRCAAAVVGSGSGDYHDDGPRERVLPRDSPRRTRQRSPRALNETEKSIYTSVQEPDREGNGLRKALPRRREPDNEGNS